MTIEDSGEPYFGQQTLGPRRIGIDLRDLGTDRPQPLDEVRQDLVAAYAPSLGDEVRAFEWRAGRARFWK